ncbi:MAG: addiction module antidote protein [Betaproteobacteria bacterium]
MSSAAPAQDVSRAQLSAEALRADPELAARFLNDALAEGLPEDLLIALRQLARARGGMRALARETDLNENQLYRTLSEKGNPELRSLTAVLGALGLRLAVAPAHPGAAASCRHPLKKRNARWPDRAFLWSITNCTGQEQLRHESVYHHGSGRSNGGRGSGRRREATAFHC